MIFESSNIIIQISYRNVFYDKFIIKHISIGTAMFIFFNKKVEP